MRAVERFLALPDKYVYSVVVFVGNATIKTKKELPSNVVYLRKLRSYIRSHRERLLSAHEVGSIAKKVRDHQAGVTPAVERTAQRSAVNTLPVCPECGATMVRRTATKGRYSGRKFWGCSSYPSCKGIRNT